jgi:hypothetical protein
MPPEVATDDFSAAFDRLAELGEKTPEDSQTAPAAQTEQPAEEPPAAEPPAEEPPAAEPPAEEPPAEEPAEVTEPQMSDDELLAKFAEMVRQPAQKEPEPQPAPAATDTPTIYTADEQKFLSDYEKDWPDVARAESLRRRAEYRDLVGYVFAEIAKEFGPLVGNVQTVLERTHLQDIHEKVEDYDNVRDKVVSWVDKQPNYLQAAYKHVIHQGTPDEIADLVSRYKREAGVAQTPSTTRRAETELPQATKQAAASLAPVSSKRSAVIQGSDPNDFEGAFSEFAKSL